LINTNLGRGEDMTTASLALDTLDQKLSVERWRGDTRDARCPAHDDRRASLTYGPGESGGTVMMCHAGCTTEAILEALDMTFADLSPEPHIVETYNYLDEQGNYLWHVERWMPKDFRCRPGLPPPAQRRLYRSELLPVARQTGQTVYVVEGEKDVNTLIGEGFVAVCGVGGAGSWLPSYSDQLANLDVVVIADSDDPGRQHARAVVHALDGKAASTALCEPSYGKDVTDQLNAGYGIETLIPLPVDETLGIHRADQIQEREIEWLWPGYFPSGKMVIIEGDPGDGKSVMSCDLAARFSTGARLPDGSRCTDGPIDIVMVSAEDDPNDTIKPRLRVAGADLTKIHLITEGSIPGSPFDLGRDVGALEHFVRRHNVKIVFIDPLMAFMPAGVNTNSDHEVRRALHPLIRMSFRTGCTLVVIRHLTKGRTKAITAGGGSIAFIGAARVGFLVGPHPDDEAKRVFSCVKINVGEKPPTLGYVVKADRFNPKLPRVTWDDSPLSVSAQEILDHEDDSGEGKGAKDDARAWLEAELLDAPSGRAWKEIVGAGRVDGHSEATLRRVRNGVARAERNPPTIDGWQRVGTYWYHRDAPAVPTTKQQDDEPPAQPVTLGPTGVCDICTAQPALFFKTEGVNRCSVHNPRIWEASA
jgi:putative DNA primase/helicase